MNDLTLSAVNQLYSPTTGDKEKLFFVITDRKPFLENLGQIGIPLQKGEEFIQILYLAYGDGVYEDSYGNKRKISKKQQDNLKYVAVP